MSHKLEYVDVDDKRVPKIIRQMVELISGFDKKDIFIKEDRMSGREEAAWMSVLILEQLYVCDMSFLKHFFEKGYTVEAIMGEEIFVLYEYDGWYINPYVGVENGKIQARIVLKDSIEIDKIHLRELNAINLVRTFGIFTEGIVGIDFTTQKWIKFFLKDYDAFLLLFYFVRAEIWVGAIKKLRGDGHFKIKDDRPCVDQESILLVGSILDSVLMIGWKIQECTDTLDLLTDIYVVFGQTGKNKRGYWIEFGDYYFIKAEKGNHLAEFGLTKELRNKREMKYPLIDVMSEAKYNKIRNNSLMS